MLCNPKYGSIPVFKNVVKRIRFIFLFSGIFFLFLNTGWSQISYQQIAFWNFQDESLSYTSDPTSYFNSQPTITFSPAESNTTGTAFTDSTGTVHPAGQAAFVSTNINEINFDFTTEGFRNIFFRFDYKTTLVTLFRISYSTDGINYTILGDSSTTADDAWHSQKINLSGISALANNPNPIYIKLSTFNDNSGTWAFDNLSVMGTADVPTIAVSPTVLTDLSYGLGTGPSSEQILTLNAINLTSDITVSFSKTNSAFEISKSLSGPWQTSPSTITFTPASGIILDELLYVRLKKDSSNNSYSDNLLFTGSGATTRSIPISGDVTSGACSDLFISQVAYHPTEGSLIELFNSSPSSINLRNTALDYRIQIYKNGSLFSTVNFTTDAIIAPYSSLVITGGGSGLYSAAFLGGIENTNLNLSGFDGIRLLRFIPSTKQIDLIGSRTINTALLGWSAPGISTTGYNLIRKPNITQGIPNNPNEASILSSLLSDFSVDPIDRSNFSVQPGFNAGTHLCSCTPLGGNPYSDIISDNTFSYTTNIATCNYLSPSGQTSQAWWETFPGQSLSLARFTIRDDGQGSGVSPQVDALPTNLIYLMLEITNYQNLDSIALFAADASGNPDYFISAVPAGPTVSMFADILALDRSTSKFIIKATFKSTVTDRQQITLKVVGAQALQEGSTRFYRLEKDAGGAITSSSGNNNKIEVTATKLKFIQQPTTTAALSLMRPEVTVGAVDACNNIDTDYFGKVTLGLEGGDACANLSGAVVNAVNGIATFSSLRPRQSQVFPADSLRLIANAVPVVAASSLSKGFYVPATGAAGSPYILGLWNFTDNNLNIDAGEPMNLSPAKVLEGKSISSLSANYNDAGNYFAGATGNRAIGRGWVIPISTAGFESISFSCKQKSDINGPRDYEIYYSLDGITYVNTGVTPLTTYMIGGSFGSAVVRTLPSTVNDRTLIYIFVRIASTVSVTGGGINTTTLNTSYIDDIQITGNSLGVVDPRKNYYYRSDISGNYSNPCLWQFSPDNSIFDQAPTYPDSSTLSISVQNNHTVTLDLSPVLPVDQFTIADSGIFILPAGKLLRFENGSGVEMTLKGTFRNESLFGADVIFGSGATWQFGTSGVRTFTNRGSFDPDVWHNAYQGGWSSTSAITSNNPQTWKVQRKTIGVTPKISSIITRYPNLVIEDSTGTPWDMAPGSRFTGNSQLTIYGKLDIGGNGNGTVTAYNEIGSTLNLVISDSLIIRSGNTLSNNGTTAGYGISFGGAGILLNGTFDNKYGSHGYFIFNRNNGQTISGTGSFNTGYLNVSLSAGSKTVTYQLSSSNWMSIEKDLNISNTNLFTNDGTSKGYGLDVKGNINLNATGSLILNGGTSNTGRLRLSGSSAQSIISTNAGQVLTLQDFELANAAGASLTAMTQQNGLFTFTNGALTTDDTKYLTMGPLATFVGTPDDTKYINGLLRRQINTTGEKLFPIGRAAFSTMAVLTPYRPISIMPFSISTTETFSAKHQIAATPSSYLGAFTLGKRASEYWDINKVTAGSVSARIKFNYLYSNIPSDWNPGLPGPATNVAVGKVYGGSNWYLAGELDPGAPNIIESNPPYIMARDWRDASGELWTQPLSTFSPFGFIFSSTTVLPIHILSFTGKPVNQNNLLEWTIANDKDMQEISLEHSPDGREFKTLTTKLPSGNAYSYLHIKPLPGLHFYRLKLVTKSAAVSYSQIVLLENGKNKTYVVGLKQNPVQSMATPVIWSAGIQNGHISITDVAGKIYTTSKSTLLKGINQVPVYLPLGMADGMYYLNIFTDDGIRKSLPFIKN